MKVIVLRGDASQEVAVERSAEGYRVTVDGREYAVDAAPAGEGLSSLRIDGHQREVAVQALGPAAGGGGDHYRYTPAGAVAPVDIEVLAPLAHLAGRAQAAAGGATRRKTTAYMPGRVVAVLAAEGSEVEAGQGVVVLEAMKMENEIQAESSGVVRAVFVEIGQAVEGGDPLFEVG